MKQKMTTIVIALCTVLLGSSAAAHAKGTPLGFQVETVPEYGGAGVFTAIGVLGIVAVTLYRKLGRKATSQENS